MFHFQQNLQKGSIEKSCLYRDNNMYKIQRGFVKLDGLVKSLLLAPQAILGFMTRLAKLQELGLTPSNSLQFLTPDAT